MTFINESIPEDIKQTFDFSVFHDPFGRPHKFESWGQPMWTIDKERDAFLIYTGGGGGEHVGTPREEWFGLWWKGDVVHFSGQPIVTEDEKGQLLTWQVPKLFVPPHLIDRRAEFVALLKDALEGKGLGYRRDYVYAVKVDLQ